MATSRPSKFPRVPYAGIRFHLGRVHVGTPDVEVMADVAHAANRAGARRAEIVECVRYALDVHRENGALFRRVTSGRL